MYQATGLHLTTVYSFNVRLTLLYLEVPLLITAVSVCIILTTLLDKGALHTGANETRGKCNICLQF